MNAAATDAEPRDDRVPRHLSISNEHATPVEVIEAARVLLGDIDLDPASCALAQTRVKAGSWFGLDHNIPVNQNALVRSWDIFTPSGCKVFLNPPGGKINGQSSAKVFWFKLVEEYERGHIESAVFLGFSIEILQTTQVKIPVWHRENGPNDRHSVSLPIPLDFPICVPSRRLKFDKMVPRCTLCGRFIDPDRAKLLKDSLDLCHPKFKLTDSQKTLVEKRGGRLEFWRGEGAEFAPGYICARNGVEHWGPLDFASGDSPPHSNVLVYLPPHSLSADEAKAKFQAAFAAIGRVR